MSQAARSPLDVDGDGSISHQEYFAWRTREFNFMGPSRTANRRPVSGRAEWHWIPETVGTAYLKGNQVLVAPDDELLSESIVLYLDYEYDINEEWTMIE